MIGILSPLGSNTHLRFHSILLLSCLQPFIANCQTSPSQCYYNTNGTTFSSPDYVAPCGTIAATSGFLSCCDLGAKNFCLSNNLCYDPNRISGQHYYLSPCTDASYTASQCHQYCSNRPDKDMLDVIYDYNAQLWRCCSSNPDGSANCTNPTDETFNAPPPESLSVEYPASATNPTVSSSIATLSSPSSSLSTISASSTPTTTTTSSSTTSSTPSSTTSSQRAIATQKPSSSPSLSPGGIAGIAIGAAVGLIIIIIIISVPAVLYYRHRREESLNPPSLPLLRNAANTAFAASARELREMQQSGFGRLSPPNLGDDP